MRTHFKPTETFQYTFFTTCHPPGAKKGFLKGEENITTLKKHLSERGYPQNLINNTLSEVKFQERTQALLQRNKTKKPILPFITQYHPAVPNFKEILTRSAGVSNKATTIVKSNLQGTAHNIIQKGALT